MRPWLGTYVSIEACAADATRAALAVDNAFAEIATLHAAMSFHSASSELACLHREAHRRPTRIGWHSWAVLAQALRLARLSEGVFDPTIAPQLVRHKALPRPDGPAPDEAGSWRDIELSGRAAGAFSPPAVARPGWHRQGLRRGLRRCRAAASRRPARVRNAGGDHACSATPRKVRRSPCATQMTR